TELTGDGQAYDFQVFPGGRYGVYAYYGVLAPNGRFTPYLLGVKRDIEVKNGETRAGADVILSVPLATDIPITVTEPPAPPGSGVTYEVFSYLDLGPDGIVPVYDHYQRSPGSGGSGPSYTPLP